MALSENTLREYTKRLLLSRMRILNEHGFYGLLLMHVSFSVDESVETACADGERITFGTSFLETLSDKELDFVLMHEILHIALCHCLRVSGYEHELFNIACDIVVNSTILAENNGRPSSITLKDHGELMHIAPDGKEGAVYTAEQVYKMLEQKYGSGGKNNKGCDGNGDNGSLSKGGSSSKNGSGSGKKRGNKPDKNGGGQQWDDHSRWVEGEADSSLRDKWAKHIADAAEAVSVRDPSNGRGLVPAFAERLLKELKKPQTDWRTILNDFIREEITDYSFMPPDRRFSDSGFFLPDFNEKENIAENILFMIDTSASMSDDMVAAAYSEVKGAIDQFAGKLTGKLGFFDAAVIEPKPFVDEDEFMVIKPIGGGGTSFDAVFDYVRLNMSDDLPASIIMLTDGYAPFPPESAAGDIPVLWLLNNEEVDPPWGKTARIKV